MNKQIISMLLTLFILHYAVSQKCVNEDNETIKQQVENAGCQFHDKTQWLRESICLMPHYQRIDPPEKSDRKIKVDIDY